MKNIKKYLIGFIVGLGLVSGLSYASQNGTIGDLFKKNPLGINYFLKPVALEKGSLSQGLTWTASGASCAGNFCTSLCLDLSNKIVGTKIISNGGNYDECFISEGGVKVELISIKK